MDYKGSVVYTLLIIVLLMQAVYNNNCIYMWLHVTCIQYNIVCSIVTNTLTPLSFGRQLLIFPYTFSCLKTWKMNMNNPYWHEGDGQSNRLLKCTHSCSYTSHYWNTAWYVHSFHYYHTVLTHYTRFFYCARCSSGEIKWPCIVRIRHTHVRYWYSFRSLKTATKNWSKKSKLFWIC